ncbi:hypothetical protein HAV38_11730, partial [Glaciimonas immobilis]
QPQFKSSPVMLRRLSFGEPEQWLLNRMAELDGRMVEPFANVSLGGSKRNVDAAASDETR